MKQEYKGFQIFSDGFIPFTPGSRFGSIAKVLVINSKIHSLFAFVADGMSLTTHKEITISKLLDIAFDVVKQYINEDKIINTTEYTFEYEHPDFEEVKNPSWWTFSKK